MAQCPFTRREVIVASGVSGSALVAGCIGGDADNELTDTDTLQYTLQSTIGTIDPRNMELASDHAWSQLAYNSLLKNDYSEEDGVHITGDLATEWEWLEEDGETLLQFQIREGVQFQNGDSVNAEILADEINYWLDPETESIQRTNFSELNRASVDSEYVLNLHLDEIWAALPVLIAYYMGLGNPYLREEMGTDAFGNEPAPSGTGPYEVVEWDSGNRIRLERFDDYYEDDLPHFEGAEVTILPEQSTRLARLEAGDLHVDTGIGATGFTSLEDSANVETTSRTSPYFLMGAVNNEVEPLGDNQVRRALRLATDAEALIEVGHEGFGSPVSLMHMPDSWWEWNDLDQRNRMDVEQANQLLAEAGYEDGFEVELSASNLSRHQSMAQALQGMWADIGVDVELNISEYSSMLGDVIEGNFTMMLNEFRSVNDPGYGMNQSVVTEGTFPTTANGWPDQNPELYEEFVNSLEEGRTTLDTENQYDAYTRAFEIFADEMPFFVFGALETMAVYRSELEGFWQHPRAEVGGESLRQVNL